MIMPSKNFPIFHIFWFIFNTCLCSLILIPKILCSAPFKYNCDTTQSYTPNSFYKSNLNFLLSNLSSEAKTENGFFNYTSGNYNSSDRVYGLFLCRGDVSAHVCQICVTNGTKDILRLCPNSKEAIVIYDYCMVRYSDKIIFGAWVDEYTIFYGSDERHNVGEPEIFFKVLENVMADLIIRVANDARKGKKFATQEANFTDTQKVYALAQCTPDISSNTCKACLTQAISNFPISCKKSKSCRVVLLNCIVWYEFFLFYDSKFSAPPRLQPQRQPQRSKYDHGRNLQFSAMRKIAIAIPVISVVLFTFTFGFAYSKRKANGRKRRTSDKTEQRNAKSRRYDFGAIQDATNNFSVDNKVGQGGFGDVYKGKLINGQQIAVKRLSKGSNQGAKEFKSEVHLVAKLQHKNLVRLLGFCLHGEERILIYEFVPNKSLESHLFDLKRDETLNWAARVKIIRGIARGLLYLHEDCPLKIVHRDLKPSNILLDKHLEPKISDFGMARIFGVDQSQGNTMKVAGTHGYMSPEYVMYGQYSVKSDVFSFGVLTLETVTAKKNNSFYLSDEANDLLSYVWKRWKEGTTLELVDPKLGDSYSIKEMLRYIQIGLLCVQKDVQRRPTMALVVLMLSSNSVTLPIPQRPAFFVHSKTEILANEFTADDYSSMYKDVEASI